MKIGVCGGIEEAPIIKAIGYDYIEESMVRIASLSETDFSERARAYEKLGLPVYSFNLFFGGGISLYGENALDEVRAYAKGALSRAGALGGKICVIGSGKARAVPEGVSRAFAQKRFAEVIALCGEIAEGYGIKIAVEPLNRKESNLINTIGEAAEIAEMTGRQNVGSVVDFYHFAAVGESDDAVTDHADTLIHAHLSRTDRFAPKIEDAETISHWINLLESIGYAGALSIEAKSADFASDMAETARCLALAVKG